MADSDESVELLFFDTFSHEKNEDINLDLVQFPQPVYITEVRIIPLGAHVHADFPGGKRLGATNPSKFHIHLYVNDLSKPGASTFENLGDFEYNQNGCISLQCNVDKSPSVRQLPTDGLVISGCYTTITLAIYGLLAKDEVTDQISSPTPPVVPVEEVATVRTNDEKDINAFSKTGAIDFSQALDKRDTKKTANDNASNDIHPDSSIVSIKSNSIESVRKYTEEWVATTGNAIAAIPNAETIEAKSPDDNWGDDDLNKTATTATTISSPHSQSPDSQKRKREPSPDYRWHRGVLDKKISKTKEYVASRGSPTTPTTPTSRSLRASTPEYPTTPVSESRRPRTPDSHRHDDEFNKSARLKSREMDNNGGELLVSASTIPGEPDDELSQGEAFEPILSDDEILDDAIDQYEIEYEDTDADAIESALKQFNPFNEEVKQYVVFDESATTNANIKELIELATKCLHRSKLRECTNIEKTFIESQSNELRENWVHAAEQLIQIINLIYNLAGSSYARGQKALSNLGKLNRQPLVDWMRIGLNFDCANAQQQPGFKIRHMKCGLRLIEMLGVEETFVGYLIYQENFDVFDRLFRLYEQKFMALPLKLMICRAIYACLDTRTGIEFFTRTITTDAIPKLPSSEFNGYQKVIKLIQANPLTRLKFALRSILKKVHLYESLQVIGDVLKRQFNSSEVKLEQFDESDVASDEKLLQNCLKEVWSAFTWDAQSYAQPKRFLPISMKFEKVVDANASKMAANSFIRYFRTNGLLESLLVIVSHSTTHSIVSDDVFDLVLLLLESLCRNEFGLSYLCEKCDVTNVLIKCLIQATNDSNGDDGEVTENDGIVNATMDDTPDGDDDSRRYQLGIEIAYKIKSKYCLDAIADVPMKSASRDDLLTEHFYTLYSLAVADNYLGRDFVIETITMDANIIIILKQIEAEKANIRNSPKETANNEIDRIAYKRPPTVNYAIDLIDLTIRHATTHLEFLRTHFQLLLNLVNSHDQFNDAAISHALQETAIYLKPLQIQNVFSYDNISSLLDVIKRNMEFITTFSGDLIMALRIIRYLATPDVSTFNCDSDFADTFGDASATQKFKINQDQHQVELKYKFVILQLYSADGAALCVQILEKLTAFYSQPSLHTSTLSAQQGQQLVQIVLPTIEILRKMLTYVIDCRNTEFKDLTAIEPLLKTYTLVSYIPAQSIAGDDAQRIQKEITQILMAYTQPTSTDGVDTETVHKSLWSQVIGELCKYIMIGPYTILPGLTIFSQLLPVPLPVLTKHSLTLAQQNRLITERQLWSAYLHPQSIELSEMIQSLCISSYAPLIDSLSRVLGQLADLAPNMALLVTKAVADLLLTDGTSSIRTAGNIQNGSNSTSIANSTNSLAGQTASSSTATSSPITSPATASAPATSNTNQTQTQTTLTYINPLIKRVLAFLSNLLCYAPIKVAFLSVAPGKIFDQLIKVMTVKAATIPANLQIILYQQQELVLMIYHTILNADISLIANGDYSANSKLLLEADSIVGCSLPPKECLNSLTVSILDWLLNSDDSSPATGCQFAALKTMTLLTNYDYTTYQLKLLLEKRKDLLLAKLRAFSQLPDDDHVAYDIPHAFIQLLLSLLRSDVVKSERSYFLTDIDLLKILQFKRTPNDKDNKPTALHPLLLLQQNLLRLQSKSELPDHVKGQIGEMLFSVDKLIASLDAGIVTFNANKEYLHTDSPATEPAYPTCENIVTQYSMRTIYTVATNELKAADYPEQLTVPYWSANRFEEFEGQSVTESVACDFLEIVKAYLPPDTNLTTDCKRLLHLSASPPSNRERTSAVPFRARRIEIPNAARPEKKPYISRGRGFPRAVQSRGDLFRSRPPNTSRPPSLHVDDFLALETCGAQPTGPTGYNKLSRDIISIRGTRGRGRGRGILSSSAPYIRHSTLRRTNSPSWPNHSLSNSDSGGSVPPSQHFRTATSEPVSHFQSDYFGGGRGSRRGSLRPPRTFNKFN